MEENAGAGGIALTTADITALYRLRSTVQCSPSRRAAVEALRLSNGDRLIKEVVRWLAEAEADHDLWELRAITTRS